MKRTLTFLLISASLLQFGSCRRDGGPSWDTGIVLPLAHASLTIDNLLADSLSSTNPDGSVKIVYSTQFLGLDTDTLFNIPDTTISNTYNIPFGTMTFLPGAFITPLNTPTETTYNISSAQLVTGILNEGKMYLHLRNDIRRRVILRYQIPCATLNAVPFDASYLIPAAVDSLTSSEMDVVIDLAGYTIDFTGTNNDQVNTITTLFTARIDPTETNAITVYPTDVVGVINTFSEIELFYMRGYFGNENIQIGPEETGFTLFSKVISGSIGLDSLKMWIDIDNYIGMDSRLTINNIWSRNTRTGQTVNLLHSIIGTPINVNRGVYSSTWPDVIPSSYNFTFDNSNSNAKALVENLPDQLGYDVTLVTNPLGNVSGNNDFLFADKGIDATLNVEMPLNLFADQLVITDTIIPDFSSFTNHEDILKGTLTLRAANSFPFAASLDLYFLDVNGNITGSVVATPNTITSGPVTLLGGYYVSQGFSNSQVQIPLNETQTRALFNSNRIVFVSKFDTNSNPVYAKVFSTNRLDLNLSADFEYRIGN